MLHIDALTAYLICGVSALAGAALLRLAESDDAQLRAAVRVCGWGLVTLGAGLLPTGLGSWVGHVAAQLWIAIGSTVGLALFARGVGLLQGRDFPVHRLIVLASVIAAVCIAAWLAGPLRFGLVYALVLAGVFTLVSWLGRGFIQSPRDSVEHALGLTLLLVSVSCWVRAAFTAAYVGPWKPNLLYVPGAMEPFIATLYGVIPMVIATLLLSLVNARLSRQLRSRAATDELTGTMTRRALGELAPATIEHARRRQQAVAVLMLDLDHFKRINDTYGHATGDKVLKVAAATLLANLRHDVLLARYGGEEFVAVVPVEDLAAARLVAERLREAIATADWSTTVQMLQGVTTSIGVALVSAGNSLEDTLRLADHALYQAKREGRNCVQVNLMAA